MQPSPAMHQPRVTFLCLLLSILSFCPSHTSGVEGPPSDADGILTRLQMLEKISQLKEDDDISKRQSNFMRIGRAGNFLRIGRPSSGFVRIGKSDEEFGTQPGYGILEKRMSGLFNGQPMHRFIRIGRTPQEEKRASSFVRIGKVPSNFLRIGRSVDDGERFRKRGSSFLRIGKSSGDQSTLAENLKRASAFVRIGKSPLGTENFPKIFADDFNPTPDFIRSGSLEPGLDGPDKRQGNFLRIGRGFDSPDGQTLEDGSSPADMDKRASSFVRIGKSSAESPNDLASFSAQDNLANEDGALGDDAIPVANRNSGFVRIGKAPNSFVRIGKAPNSFVRIGKAPNSFVRIGKAPNSFVRIGKAPNSFVRIGK